VGVFCVMKKFAKIISSEKKWFQVSTDTSFTYPLIPVSFKWFEERKRRQKEYKRAKQRQRVDYGNGPSKHATLH
jgi:hypothetical protein